MRIGEKSLFQVKISMSYRRKIFLRSVIFLFSSLGPVCADVLVAIVDTGVDTKHREIAPHLREELPMERSEESFLDNFIDDSLTVQCYHGEEWDYLNLRLWAGWAVQTEMERKLLRKAQRNSRFFARLTECMHFLHGSHMAGIVLEGQSLEVKIVPVKLPLVTNGNKTYYFISNFLLSEEETLSQAKAEAFLVSLAQALVEFEIPKAVAEYFDKHQIAVANNAFVFGYDYALRVLQILIGYRGDIFPISKAHDNALVLLKELLNQVHSRYVASAPKTLFVFAAGNTNRRNNDETVVIPANIRAANAITVGAVDLKGSGVAEYSSFGVQTVDVLAHGTDVRSSIPQNKYLRLSGTSQAAATVSNLAAQIKTINPNLSAEKIKAIILKTATIYKSLKDKVVSSGVVNRRRALQMAIDSLP